MLPAEDVPHRMVRVDEDYVLLVTHTRHAGQLSNMRHGLFGLWVENKSVFYRHISTTSSHVQTAKPLLTCYFVILP